MLKNKKLWYVLGIGAVAYYYFWMQNKKKKDLVAPTTNSTNFTGDLGITQY